MPRTLFALALGVLVGVGTTLLLIPERVARIEPAGTLSAPASSASQAEAGRVFYRRVADAGAAELASLLRAAAAEPPSARRELELAVLLDRYAEDDAAGAARLARETRAGDAALASVYGVWTRTDPAAALAALEAVEDPGAAAAAALAVVTALGNDADAIERVASRLAAREPEAPISSVVPAFGPGMVPVDRLSTRPRSALGLMAERWAELYPQRALALTRDIRDEPLRLALEAAALRALARASPDRAFAYLGTQATESRQIALFGAAGPELARADPERLLALVDNLSMGLRDIVATTALSELAERDPLAASRYVERMTSGMERQGFAQHVARAYGKRDAEAALEWARTQPNSRDLVDSVIIGAAERDPHRALDLALELPTPVDRMRSVQTAGMIGVQHDSTAEAIVNRLVALDDPQLDSVVALTVVPQWAFRSPDNAMRWLLANGQSASPSVFERVGQQLAMGDARRAIGYAVQMPTEAREPWIRGVAQGYAQYDPQGAVDWLLQFRAEPWYGRTAVDLAQTVAQYDGPAAAHLVSQVDTMDIGPQAQRLASSIATTWANRDPAAAAQWAADRPTEEARTLAVRNAVGIWTTRDADAARQWTLRLPQGATRDAALTMMLTTIGVGAPGGLDSRVLSAFSSDIARQRAVLHLLQSAVYVDPPRARAVADAYLSDAALRAEAQRLLQAARDNATERPAFDIQFETTQ